MRSRGKAGLLELFLWDIILVVLTLALAFFNASLESPSVPEPRPSVSGGGEADPPNAAVEPRAPSGADDVPAPPPAPLPDQEARAKTELASIAERAEERVEAGELARALELYAQAPPWLKASRAWSDAWPRVEARLQGLQHDADLFVCLRPEVQFAADRGDVKRVRGLLARVPASQRSALESEVGWARAHVAREDGLQIRGFSPDRIELKGRRCSLECELGRADASQIVDEIDALLERGARLLGKRPGDLVVRVLGASEAAMKPRAMQVILYQREGETAALTLPRIRLAAARWLVQRTVKRQSTLHAAFERLICGAAGGALNGEGAARRRLFLAQRPDGSGAAIMEAVRGDRAATDPAGVRLWALARFALTGSHPAAVDLKTRLKQALREDERALQTWLTPLKAAGLEPTWLAFMERG